jgi:hypothetical protein
MSTEGRDGLGRLRSARRKLYDQDRYPSTHHHGRGHCQPEVAKKMLLRDNTGPALVRIAYRETHAAGNRANPHRLRHFARVA